MSNTTWDGPTRRTVAIVLGILSIYLIYLARPVLPFLIIAGLIAFILAPIITLLHERLRFPKGLAIMVAYSLFIVTVLLIPLIIVPALISAFAAIRIDPVAVVTWGQEWIIRTLENYRMFEFFGFHIDLSPNVDSALEYITTITPGTLIPSLESLISYIPSTIQLTWDMATGLFGRIASVTLAIVLTLLYSIYMSASANDMRQTIFKFIPPAYQPEFAKLGTRIQRVWSAYLRGQLTLAIIIWLVTWLAGEVIGLPGAFALGIIAGAMEIIPNLGPILAAIPALLAALLQGSTRLDVSNFTFFLIVLGIYIVIQQLENNIIVPKVLGEAVELSSLTVMVGVVIGFTVGGILGSLVAAPIIATGREVVFYAYAKVLMQDPYPFEEERIEQNPSFLESAKTLWRTTRTRLQVIAPKSSISPKKD